MSSENQEPKDLKQRGETQLSQGDLWESGPGSAQDVIFPSLTEKSNIELLTLLVKKKKKGRKKTRAPTRLNNGL